MVVCNRCGEAEAKYILIWGQEQMVFSCPLCLDELLRLSPFQPPKVWRLEDAINFYLNLIENDSAKGFFQKLFGDLIGRDQDSP